MGSIYFYVKKVFFSYILYFFKNILKYNKMIQLIYKYVIQRHFILFKYILNSF